MPKPKKSALPVWPDPAREPHGADGKLSVLIEANLLRAVLLPSFNVATAAARPKLIGHLDAILAAPWAAKVLKMPTEGKGAGSPNQQLLLRALRWLLDPSAENRRLLMECFTSWPFMGRGGFSDQFSPTHTRHWLSGVFAALVVAQRRADQEMVAAIVAWLTKLFACWRAHLCRAKNARGKLVTMVAMPGSRSGATICQSQVIDLVEALLKGKPPKPKEGVDELPSRLAKEVWPTLKDAWGAAFNTYRRHFGAVTLLNSTYPRCLDTVVTNHGVGGSFESRCAHPDHQQGAPSPPVTWVRYDAGRQEVTWGTD